MRQPNWTGLRYRTISVLGKTVAIVSGPTKRMAKTGRSAAFQVRYDRNEVYADETES
jgi:hypothetical protein